MMEYEPLGVEGWLEEAPFFSHEPSDYSLNFDLLKANKEADPVTEFNDLPWYDENINLSLLEDIPPLGDPSKIQLSETDIKDLLSLIGNSDNSYLPSDNFNLADDLNVADFNLNAFQNQDPSLVSPVDFPFSPDYEAISEASSPAESPFSPDYDASADDSPGSVESSDDALCNILGLGTDCVPSVATSADQSCKESMPAVFVTVCDSNTEDSTVDLSLEEVSNSVRKRKFVNNGGDIPKVRVSLRNTFHPYSKGSSKRRNDKSERKKVQNKEAAARYRIKKRIEEQELSEEVSGLEAEQKKLQTQHDDLATEIKYLKKLMREMLEKKGII